MRAKLFNGQEAPDFELPDLNGDQIRLSDFRGKKVVMLAFLRGFM
jgi:peroxiredoxin